METYYEEKAFPSGHIIPRKGSTIMKDLKSKIVVICIITGGLYGFFSATFNQNPYYLSVGHRLLVPESERYLAWRWQPSPVWLPSYLLCRIPRNGLGVTHTKSGYMFRSVAGLILYFSASTILGMVFGALFFYMYIGMTWAPKQS